MELKKGQNMIEHEAEIYSRPARTWFQSGKEKERAEGSYVFFVSGSHAYWVSELSKQLHENGSKTSSRKQALDETKARSSNTYRHWLRE